MLRYVLATLLCAAACQAAQQQIVLISGTNTTDRVSISGYLNNLETVGFNDKTTTACVVSGVWLLYSNADYNTNSLTGNAVHYLYGDNVCSGSTYIEQEITSVRYAGSISNWKANGLNLYSKNFYQGREQYVTSDAYTILVNGVASAIVTGTQPWILFEQENFSGNGVCLPPYEAAYSQPGLYPRLTNAVKSAKISDEAECAFYPIA